MVLRVETPKPRHTMQSQIPTLALLRGLYGSSPSPGEEWGASLQGHREESQGEGSGGGEPRVGSGTIKKRREGKRRRLNRRKSKGKKIPSSPATPWRQQLCWRLE